MSVWTMHKTATMLTSGHLPCNWSLERFMFDEELLMSSHQLTTRNEKERLWKRRRSIVPQPKPIASIQRPCCCVQVVGCAQVIVQYAFEGEGHCANVA